MSIIKLENEVEPLELKSCWLTYRLFGSGISDCSNLTNDEAELATGSNWMFEPNDLTGTDLNIAIIDLITSDLAQNRIPRNYTLGFSGNILNNDRYSSLDAFEIDTLKRLGQSNNTNISEVAKVELERLFEMDI